MRGSTETGDVIIIGAGAAGLMCAIEAGRRGRKVLVLEHSEKPGEKIRISGGGRCNFTNREVRPEHFLSANPRFCVSALSRFTPRDFIDRVEAHGIAWHEKTLGQLFCDGSARQIVDMLLAECGAAGVRILLNTRVAGVAKDGKTFCVRTDAGEFRADAVVIATGGPSVPKTGATGFGYEVARGFGLDVVPPRPGLVPLTLPDATLAAFAGLPGVALDVEVRCGKVRFSGAMLFTHRGLSGPAILQISSYWREGEAITVDLAPGVDVFEVLKKARLDRPKQGLRTALFGLLPRHLAARIAENSGVEGRLGEISDKRLRAVAALVNDWRVIPSGTEGDRTAEVTVGGVDTSGLSSKTLECKRVPGLYFIGEVVDVTGHLGGFNFQWAWASGHAAGQFV
ncbi:MAG: NAD(P)/FAD-dependent oxidoreductase [Leptospirillia bacterium]